MRLLAAAIVAGSWLGAPRLAAAQGGVARDSVRADSAPPLTFRLNTRIEGKQEKAQNLRCVAAQLFNPAAGCRAGFIPGIDVHVDLKSFGAVGERFLVDVDYDSKRELDASNNLSVRYTGPAGARISRVELGNVDFVPPESRFITGLVPAGNYGFQAVTRLGPFEVRAVAAQQKGNIVRANEFIVGDRTVQSDTSRLEDYQVERLRFFFTVDPARFGALYPNLDILDRNAMAAARAQLPDTLRPARVVLYRSRYNGVPENPGGPRFRLNGAEPGTASRQTYDVLREGVDYVMDPSRLWFALVRPLSATAERLVVAYTVTVGGVERVWPTTGGTPDLMATGGDQVANLVWDQNATVSSPAFRQEIRSAYRVGGDEVVRTSVRARIIAGVGGVERPIAGSANSFLRMFGVAQANNDAELDAENRLWPRQGDPVFNLAAGAGDAASGVGSRIIRELFLIFPSLRPFALRDSGLVDPGNPANPAIYTQPNEHLVTTQHPVSVYRIEMAYQSIASIERGVLTLGAVQLRPGSERILVEDRPLLRGRDYRIDYELGMVTFFRPDTLFPRPRPVRVQYEENPFLLEKPTAFLGFVTELPLARGGVAFTAFRRSQQTAYTRPQLGFEAASTLMAGLTARYTWDLPAVDRLAAVFPGARAGPVAAPSRLTIRAEVAASRPQVGSGQAEPYVHSFEDAESFTISLTDSRWYFGSLPAYGRTLAPRFGPSFFEAPRAAAIAWQTNALPSAGSRAPIAVSIREIDPLTTLIGTGFTSAEPMLWLTLHPLRGGGLYDPATGDYDWTVANAPAGRRFRSIRTVLDPAGADLSRAEQLELWTLADTSAFGRLSNPTLILDFGDLSENSLAFAPETLTVRANAEGGRDSIYAGRRVQGFDALNSERDPFTRLFDVSRDDVGLPGDLVDRLTVIDGASATTATNIAICRGSLRALRVVGDTRANCTAGNTLLDEEDIDLDQALNLPSSVRDRERLRRYIVDLSDPRMYSRVGGEYTDSVLAGPVRVARTRRWVLVRLPFNAPDDSIGDVQARRLRALRITVVSGSGAADGDLVQIPIARLRVTGAPWLRRSDRALAGIAGEQPGPGRVLVSTVGTADSSDALVYQPPPGVRDEADTRASQFQPGQITINEQSLRVQAVDLPLHHRAEAYYRFPGGEQNFMAFRELRLWGRGRNAGWGTGGELQMFVRVGRDADNFYFYRTPVHAGASAAAWEPEIRVDFNRLIALRSELQRDFVGGSAGFAGCSGVDSALIAASGPALSVSGRRYAVCRDGYIVSTTDPATTPPNLYAVQELGVGIVRVAVGGTGTVPTLPGDTLELWVDDIRLSGVVTSAGYAGEIGADLALGDVGDIHVSFARRDPHFRQLGEQPSFLDERQLTLASTIRLDRFLPARLGLALPLTVTRSSVGADPLFLQRSDLRGDGITALRSPRTSSTVFALAVRRAERSEGGTADLLLDNLSATSSYTRGGARSEYHDASHRNFDLTVDYVLASDSARGGQLPWWLDRVLGALPAPLRAGPVSAIRGTTWRLNPALVRVSSGISRGADRRSAFLVPSAASIGGVETGARESRLERDLWRNGTTLELRPTDNLSLRWDGLVVHDLRQYGDTNVAALAATRSRSSLLGADVGLERERTLISQMVFAPVFSPWLRPRVELGTYYAMVRDPNQSGVRGQGSGVSGSGVAPIDSAVWGASTYATSPFAIGRQDELTILPRRLTASQTLGLGTSIDAGKALGAAAGSGALVRWIARTLLPLELRYDRSTLAAFDEAQAAPGARFQLGWVGPSKLRTLGDRPAAAAGLTSTWTASSTLLLPYGMAWLNSWRHTDTRNWVRRADPADALSTARADGQQIVFPSSSFRWSRQLPAGGLVEGFGVSAGYTESRATVAIPAPETSSEARIRRSTVIATPVSANIAWGFGKMSTAASYALTRTRDSVPGAFSRTDARESGADIGRVVRIPPSWGLGIANDVRLRAALQESRSRTFVETSDGTTRSRLQDHGRLSYSLSADTDLNDTMRWTLQASRVETFDNTLNRRFAQTVFSTVVEIQLAGGPR